MNETGRERERQRERQRERRERERERWMIIRVEAHRLHSIAIQLAPNNGDPTSDFCVVLTYECIRHRGLLRL